MSTIMFTRQHYQRLAETLASITDDRPTHIGVVEAIADMLESDNPAFDRVKFLFASGYGLTAEDQTDIDELRDRPETDLADQIARLKAREDAGLTYSEDDIDRPGTGEVPIPPCDGGQVP